MNWTEWKPFPEPNQIRMIQAPQGPGVYELKNQETHEYVLVGISVNIKRRMKSLMPPPYGVGRRNNFMKREYVLDNYHDIVYRTLSTPSRQEAKDFEKTLLFSGKYIYNT
jgi:excinuclease UvrABC nuclease subunit